MNAGLFIALEGVDGAGKSTQVAELRRRYESRGRVVHTVREPGGTPLGEAVREILLHRSELHLAVEAETLLFLASRVQLHDEIIGPALERGEVVISDRFHVSTIVYQGMAGELGRAAAVELCATVLKDRRPDVSVVLRIPLETALGRLEGERDRFEGRADFLPRVHRAFEELVDDPSLAVEGDRIIGVDASGSAGDVSERVWEAVPR